MIFIKQLWLLMNTGFPKLTLALLIILRSLEKTILKFLPRKFFPVLIQVQKVTQKSSRRHWELLGLIKIPVEVAELNGRSSVSDFTYCRLCCRSCCSFCSLLHFFFTPRIFRDGF